MCPSRPKPWLLVLCVLTVWAPCIGTRADEAGNPYEAPLLLAQINLAVNPGFEAAGRGDEVAQGWLPVGEDQLPDWDKASYSTYRRGELIVPRVETGSACSGFYGLRLFGAGATTSAVWQQIDVMQREPRPILLGAWSRLDGTGGWAELGLANVRYTDGSKAEINHAEPLVKLGTGKDWTFRYARYEPERPVRTIEVKIDLHSPGPASLVSVDDVLVAEMDARVDELEARGVNVSAPDVVVAPEQSQGSFSSGPIHLIGEAGRGKATPESVLLTGASAEGAMVLDLTANPALGANDGIEILLAPYDRKPFDAAVVADFYRISVRGDGTAQLDWGVTRNERAFGHAEDAAFFLPRTAMPPLRIQMADGHLAQITIPYDSIDQAPPQSAVWRFNVCVRRGEQRLCSAPTYSRERKFGRLLFGSASRLNIERIEGLGACPDVFNLPGYVEKNSVPWGDAKIGVALSLNAARETKAEITAAGAGKAVRQTVTLKSGAQTIEMTVPLREPGRQELTIEVSADTPQTKAALRMPVVVAKPLSAWTYERFFYEDEKAANVAAALAVAAPVEIRQLRAHVEDWEGRRLGKNVTSDVNDARIVKLSLPVDAVPVHEEPVADHWMVVEALGRRGEVIDEARLRFGRIPRPQPRTGTPIETARVNDRGYLEVNGKPFFAVIASLNVKNLEAGYLSTPRIGFNGAKMNCGPGFKMIGTPTVDVRELYRKLYEGGVYAAPVLWVDREKDPQNWRDMIQWMKTMPGYLVLIGGEVYRQPAQYFDNPVWLQEHGRPLVLEYHNCGNWLNLVALGKTVGHVAMYPSYDWTVSPWRVMAANYARERAVGPKIGIFSSIVVTNGPSFDIWDARTAAYLMAVWGGTGAYIYIVGDEPMVELTRGLARELTLMGPIFTAEDQTRIIEVSDGGTGLQAAERLVGQERYLIVVNPNPRSVKATYTLTGGAKARSITPRFEPPKEFRLKGGSAFEDELPPRWARVYRIEMAQRKQ